MTANRSTAVMQRRHEPHDSLDFFPTPPWATRALCERISSISPLNLHNAWEPACGEGDMARPLAEYFGSVHASDVHDYSETFPGQQRICDFLIEWAHPARFQKLGPDWIITNPPFRLAENFIHIAQRRATIGCAFFVRSSFLEGMHRYWSIYSLTPPTFILQFTERVPLFKGRLDREGATATSYCWIVFLNAQVDQTTFEWIPPSRRRLERDIDYPQQVTEPQPMPLLDGRTS